MRKVCENNEAMVKRKKKAKARTYGREEEVLGLVSGNGRERRDGTGSVAAQ